MAWSSEEDFYDLTDASLLDLLERRSQGGAGAGERGGDPEARRRIAALVRRFRERRLLKRACVFPRYANEEVQDELVERYFARGRQGARAETEERIADLVRFSTGQRVEVVLTCPSARMQLKEAHTHVRWPGETRVRPLSEVADRVPRLPDLERAYRDLWKFYVFTDATDPELLRRVQSAALEELPPVTNVYSIEDANGFARSSDGGGNPRSGSG